MLSGKQWPLSLQRWTGPCAILSTNLNLERKKKKVRSQWLKPAAPRLNFLTRIKFIASESSFLIASFQFYLESQQIPHKWWLRFLCPWVCQPPSSLPEGKFKQHLELMGPMAMRWDRHPQWQRSFQETHLSLHFTKQQLRNQPPIWTPWMVHLKNDIDSLPLGWHFQQFEKSLPCFHRLHSHLAQL